MSVMDDRQFAELYDAIRCMPADVCRIAVSYIEWPHNWTNFETVTVTNVGDTTTISDSNDIEPWRLIVSSATLSVGHLRWTVEFGLKSTSYIGVGITTASANRRCHASQNRFVQIMDAESWLLTPSACYGQLFLTGDHTMTDIDDVNWLQSPMVRFRIAFRADADERTIMADIQQIGGTVKTIRIWPSSSSSLVDFAVLRPCIAIVGDIQAVVRSGSTVDFKNRP